MNHSLTWESITDSMIDGDSPVNTMECPCCGRDYHIDDQCWFHPHKAAESMDQWVCSDECQKHWCTVNFDEIEEYEWKLEEIEFSKNNGDNNE